MFKCKKRDVELQYENRLKKCIIDSVACCCTLWYIALNGQGNMKDMQKKKGVVQHQQHSYSNRFHTVTGLAV